MPIRLEDLLEDFTVRSPNAAKELRELLDAEPERFIEEAFEALRKHPDQACAKFVARLLVAEPLAMEYLVDPARFPEADAVEVARCIQAADSTTEVRLAQMIRFGVSAQCPKDPWKARRILSILGHVTDGHRILPLLASLTRHPDPHVQSKAALLVGRVCTSGKGVAARLSSRDARIRANAVEALWGVNNPEARSVGLAALRDTDHRVAANAAVGLHRMGELTSIRALRRMAGNPDERFRAAGAWAMGESGDPRFVPQLLSMSVEPAGMVRRNAIRSLVRIRKRIAAMEAAGQLRITVDRDHTKLGVEVRSAAGESLSELPATAFIVTDGECEIEIVAVREAGRDECAGTCKVHILSLNREASGELCVKVYSGCGAGQRRAG